MTVSEMELQELRATYDFPELDARQETLTRHANGLIETLDRLHEDVAQAQQALAVVHADIAEIDAERDDLLRSLAVAG